MSDTDTNSLSGSISFSGVKSWLGRILIGLGRSRKKLEYGALVFIMVLMAGIRFQPWNTFVTNGQVYLSGNDGWYHIRQSMYVAQNWPNIMPYDLLTGYPVGQDAGTFGTLFDQIVGTLALIVGLGNPSQSTVALVLSITTVLFAVLLTLPVYYLTKQVANRSAGVVSAAILSLLPGLFLARGMFGNGDHQMAEAFFLFAALASFAFAFNKAQKNVFILEALHPSQLRDSASELKYAVLPGVAFTAYILTWPPGLIFFVAFGVFFTVIATLTAYKKDFIGEPVLLVGGLSFILPTLGLLLYLDSATFGSAGYTLLQVSFSALTVIACFVLIGLTRLVDETNISSVVVPISALGSVLGGATVVKLVSPETYQNLVFNLNRTLLMSSGSQTRTIAEARQFVSLGNFTGPLFNQYGLMFFIGIVGFIFLSVMSVLKYKRDESVTTHILLLVFGVFITLMAFTQVRFNYYLAPMVAIFASYGVYQAVEITNISSVSVENVELYQVLAIVMIMMLFIPGLLYPLGGTAMSQANSINNIGSYTAWEEPLEWADENTPDNGIEPYGTYEQTETPYSDYAPDAYGVLSWWDYGHWITLTAEQSPVSNPFQQHATESAEYLLATNESEAESAIEELNPDETVDTRYVYVDWQMVNPYSKLTAPVTWHPELEQSDVLSPVYSNSGQGLQTAAILNEQRYYDSLMTRMYNYHGSRADVAPYVVEFDEQNVQTQQGTQTVPTFNLGPDSTSGIKQFESVQQAQNYVNQENTTAQLGGFGLYPQEPVPALENYRLVKTSQSSALSSARYQQSVRALASYTQDNTSLQFSDFTVDPSWVKVFENVEGATVTGDGAPANSTVSISMQLQNPAQNNQFTYYQTATADENGEYEFTVPYSTTGYDNWGPEQGYGNTEVTAVGNATVYAQTQSIESTENETAQLNRTYYASEVDIPEANVLGEETTPITTTVEEVTQEELQNYLTNVNVNQQSTTETNNNSTTETNNNST